MLTTTMPLAERVQAVLTTESGFENPLLEAPLELFSEDSELTEREQDLLNWGTVFGLAFGLARTEDPCESLASVGARALAAALAAFEDYGEIPQRLRGEA